MTTDNNVRMFPRTLAQAFPDDRVEYACAIERYRDGRHDDLPLAAWVVLVIVGLVLAVAAVSK